MIEHEEQLDEVLAAYLEATEKGWAPNRQRLLECYPHLTDGLARFFAMQDRVNDITIALRPAGHQTGSSSHSTVADATAAAPEGRPAWPHLQGYLLLGELGSGGMGIVYRALQQGADREVAVKMLLGGARAGRSERDRFRTEVQAVARLQHPGIVQLFEVGEADGCPYFSMEYVPGGSLADKLDGTPMPPADAAALVEGVARAVHFAHGHGILHRDLKPANVLLVGSDPLQRVNSGPAEAGHYKPKIADFGLAKKLGDARHTATGAVLGTPSYMAPEQARSQGMELGPATDVYALGTILYECLTGRPPFKAATPMDTLLQVVSDEPVPPMQLQPKVPRELNTVCLKCLHKSPAKRYAGADELADDLRRFLKGEPVRARPSGPVERAAKWARRNPAAACLLAGCVALLVALMAVLLHDTDVAQEKARDARDQALAENRLREEAVTAKQAAEDQAGIATAETQAIRRAAVEKTIRQYAAAMHQLEDSVTSGQLQRARETMSTLAKINSYMDSDLLGDDPRSFEWGYYSNLVKQRLEASDANQLRQMSAATSMFMSPGMPFPVLTPPPVKEFGPGQSKVVLSLPMDGTVNTLMFDEKGRHLVGSTPDGKPIIWQLDKPGTQFALGDGTVRSLSYALSPDGWYLAAGEQDGTVRLWDTRDGKVVRTIGNAGGAPTAISFSPDGKRVACAVQPPQPSGLPGGAYATFKIWDAESGKPILDPPTVALKPGQLQEFRGQLKWTRDGKRLDVPPPSAFGTLSTDKEELRKQLTPSPARIDLAVHSSDGKQVATAVQGGTNEVAVWDEKTGKRLLVLAGHESPVFAAAYSPDGKRLATGTDRGIVRLWDTFTGQKVLELSVQARVESLVFSPDGARLAASDRRGDVTIWRAAAAKNQKDGVLNPGDW